MDQLVSLDEVRKSQGGRDRGQASRAAGGKNSGIETFGKLDSHAAFFVPLERETLLIAGLGEFLTGGVPAILNEDPKLSVKCTLVSFLTADKSKKSRQSPFVAILSLKDVKPGGRGIERITIRNQGHSHPFVLKHGPIELQTLLERISEVSVQTAAEMADRLIDALFSIKTGNPGPHAAAAIIRKIARKDGFVEMLGAFDEGEIYLQGWANELPAGSCRVFVSSTAREKNELEHAELCCGSFERKDLAGKAFGFSGLMVPENGLAAETVTQIFYRGRHGWKSVDVHEKRAISEARALPGQIRALLPGIYLPSADGREKLLAASQRFDGRETVSTLDVPVRIGMDFGARLNGGGVIFSGWLLNPEDRVESVTFRGKNTGYRIDRSWISQSRPDVSDAFEDLSPFLRGHGATHRHGFLTFVPCEPGAIGEAPYLEIVLKNGGSAYAPVVLAHSALRNALRKLVATLDPNVAQSSSAVENHFLPILENSESPAPFVQDVASSDCFPEASENTLVIGFGQDIENVFVLLPLLALDPALRGMPIVLSGPASVMMEQVANIRQLAAFYGLTIRTVLAANVEDQLDALQAGCQVAPSDTVTCLNGNMVPRASGWFDRLIAAYHAQDGGCIIAPTILYEDETIRWAGSWIDADCNMAELKQHYLGYPRRTLQGAKGCEVSAATFDCCILPRASLETVGGFTRTYLGTDDKGIDAALKLRGHGVKSHWVPQVEMIHPESSAGGERNWCKLSAILDRHMFDRQWSNALTDLRETA